MKHKEVKHKEKNPNILVIMTDQMRASAMGFVGQEKVKTPNLDRLVGEGTWFKNAVSNNPACTPARASVMTGMYPLTHGLVNNDVALGTDFNCLAHSLNELNYNCGYIGKWHLDSEDRGVFVPPGPRRQGFDDFWAAYNCNHEYFNAYYYLNDDPEPKWINGYEPFEQTRIALDYIKAKSEEENPYCLFLSYGPPHCPYLEAPDEYLSLYSEESIELRPNAEGVEAVDKKVIGGYYAHVSALDHCVGELMEGIKELGEEKDTIILFTSDHGDMLYSQDRGWKAKPWTECVNIPFIMKWPGRIPEGNVSEGLIGLVDVMPTLISMVGGDIPGKVEGMDLSTLVLGDESASPESAFINFYVIPDSFSYEEWRGVVTKDYTYARFKDKPWVLYNDRTDPYQLNNLVGKPDNKELEEELDQKVNEWLNKLNDPFESSQVLADRFTPGHEGGVIPWFENSAIKEGKEKRTYS